MTPERIKELRALALLELLDDVEERDRLRSILGGAILFMLEALAAPKDAEK